MIVQGLDGRRHSLDLRGSVPTDDEVANRSALHLRARALLRRLYPNDYRAEELTLPGTGGLRADFLLPGRKLLVECHGRQHHEQVGFFHESRLDFLRGQSRDRDKQRWAELNQFSYVELPGGESDDEWRARIFAGAAG